MQRVWLLVVCGIMSSMTINAAYRCRECKSSKPYVPKVLSPEPRALGYPYGADWTPCGCYQLCRFRDGWLMPVGTWSGTSSGC